MALKKQLKKAHRELEEESRKYPQQALYTNVLQNEDYQYNSDSEKYHPEPTEHTESADSEEEPEEKKDLKYKDKSQTKKSSTTIKGENNVDSEGKFHQKTKNDPFSKARKQFELLQQEREKQKQEQEREKQEKEKLHLEQQKKRSEKKKIFALKTKRGQPKLGQQIGNLLSKIEQNKI